MSGAPTAGPCSTAGPGADDHAAPHHHDIPQEPTTVLTLDPAVRETLDGTSIAHLATVLPDGAPHSVPIWVGLEGDHVVVLTGPGSRKARNLRRDPRVALSITPADDPFTPVTIRGRVVDELSGDRAWEIIDRIAQVYVGGPYPRGQERVVLLIEPETQHVGVG